MAKDVTRKMHEEAMRMNDRVQAARLSRHAFSSESLRRLEAMVSLAATELDIAVGASQLDADPWAFNVENGCVDLRTGELGPHRRDALITKLAPVLYLNDAEAPLWHAFLRRVMGGDQELVGFLQRAVGLAMIGEVREHTLFFLHGDGANGKTTFLRTLLSMFGDYGRQADPGLLIEKRSDAHPTGVADLRGARLVTTSEVARGCFMAEALVKQLTGGDRLKARFMRKDFFEFDPSHTLFMAANDKPLITGSDPAMWRRIKLIPFDVSIPTAEQDAELAAKLLVELPGVLKWALDGCRQYLASGLTPPSAVAFATSAYRAEMDDLGQFVEERCAAGAGREVEARDLYSAYSEWAHASGVRRLPKNSFGREVRNRGFGSRKDGTTRRTIYVGLSLRPLESTRSQEDDRSSGPPPRANGVTPTSGFGPGVEGLGPISSA